MDWIRIAFSLLFTTLAIGGWTDTWWWHWLGRARSIRLAPLLKLIRRSRS
jgi:hypothetical protein